MIPNILSYTIYSVITLFLLIVIVIEITTHLKSVTHISQRVFNMFEVSSIELENFKKWNLTHKCHEKYHGAIGGYITWMFTPTSIGTIIKVNCSSCKHTEDISDYDNW